MGNESLKNENLELQQQWEGKYMLLQTQVKQNEDHYINDIQSQAKEQKTQNESLKNEISELQLKWEGKYMILQTQVQQNEEQYINDIQSQERKYTILQEKEII